MLQQKLFSSSITLNRVPYKKDASLDEQKKREYYSLLGKNNHLTYLTENGKRSLCFYENNSSLPGILINGNVMSYGDEVRIKEHLKKYTGVIYYGYFALGESSSKYLSTLSDAKEIIDVLLSPFFESLGFQVKNRTVLYALHLNRPEHRHIHFLLFENYPSKISEDGKRKYGKEIALSRRQELHLISKTEKWLLAKKTRRDTGFRNKDDIMLGCKSLSYLLQNRSYPSNFHKKERDIAKDMKLKERETGEYSLAKSDLISLFYSHMDASPLARESFLKNKERILECHLDMEIENELVRKYKENALAILKSHLIDLSDVVLQTMTLSKEREQGKKSTLFARKKEKELNHSFEDTISFEFWRSTNEILSSNLKTNIHEKEKMEMKYGYAKEKEKK